MAKPATLPRWADVSGDIVVPNSGKKDVGWVKGEKPAAQYMNWLFKWICDWLSYVSAAVFPDITTAEGDIRHAEVRHRLAIPWFGGSTAVGSITMAVGATGVAYFVATSGSGIDVVFTLPLKEGDTLKTIRVVAYDNNGGSNIQVKGWKIGQSVAAVPGTLGTQLGSTATSASSANMQNLNVTGLSEVAATPTQYVVGINLNAHANVRIYAIEYTVSRV